MTDTLVVDRIESNLSRLRLPKIKEILQDVLDASEKKAASYLNFLDTVPRSGHRYGHIRPTVAP